VSFFNELHRRNVIKVGIAYVVMAWLVMQVSDVILNNIAAPDWVFLVILLLLGIGFLLAMFFAWAFELTPEGLKREHEVERSQSITPQTGKKLNNLITVIMALAVGYFAIDKFILSTAQIAAPVETTAKAEPEQTASQETPAKSNNSIAVLPFVNMSADPDQEYFSDGISEEILNALAKVKELKVAGRTSSFAFKNKNDDLRLIGDTLGVEHILEGSVRKSGTMIRITAQLIQVEDGFHLWSESYDRELEDIFAIQDEISAAILVQLKAHLIGVDIEALASSEQTNSEVYELYLLARQQIYARTTPAIQFASDQLDKAIAIDPDYAPAQALRGITTLLLSEWSYGDIPNLEAESQAKVYLDKSLELDPMLAEAWAGKGLYHSNRPGEDSQEIAALQKALSINPNLMDASNWLQIAYGETGQNRLSLEILEKMVDRDPLYRPAFNNAVLAYNQFGMHEKSWALIERIRPFMRGDESVKFSEANTWLSMGKPSKALPVYDKILADHPDLAPTRFRLSMALIQTGQYERLAKEGLAGFKVGGLISLKRTEEATLMAEKMAKEGDIPPLMFLLYRTGQVERLVELFELRWPDLDSFEADYPDDGFGHTFMLNMAQAFIKTGNEDLALDALKRVRTAHEKSLTEGIISRFFTLQEARYFALMDDQEEAIARLEQAADMNTTTALPLEAIWPEFRSLRGHPRFEANQARMVENLNRERAELGLESVEI
jgi:TolB-like protein